MRDNYSVATVEWIDDVEETEATRVAEQSQKDAVLDAACSAFLAGLDPSMQQSLLRQVGPIPTAPDARLFWALRLFVQDEEQLYRIAFGPGTGTSHLERLRAVWENPLFQRLIGPQAASEED